MDLLDLIGNTPLVPVRRLFAGYAGVEVWAKAEYFNPGGSIKDRAARSMVLAAEQSGALTPGKVILDATSGNTGIALAMIGAARGYAVQLCMPANAGQERKRILCAYGAELILTDPERNTDGSILEARRRYAATPERYFYPDQYSNDANWQAHYCGTAPEIWEQTQGRVTHFIAGLGTSGTLVGTGRRLKQYNPRVRVVALQPDRPAHGIEGLKHLATAIRPRIYDPTVADEQVVVTAAEAQAMVRRLAREEGLLVGLSAGANVAGVLKLVEAGARGVIVTVFPDAGDRYLSQPFWERECETDRPCTRARHAEP
ncbi:MAG: cysteine synthase family protein [Armatimonadetes bacterium]|jgi:cysteine synthase B|nr:cysteine synthase family protein [Armatimonadota bacterium]